MNNNPVTLSDPVGDTTWLYNQFGTFLGVINDNLKNQAHFIKTDGDVGAAVNFDALSKKDQLAYAQLFRKFSNAFIGSKTASDMRNIVNKSLKAKVEIAFVGSIGKDKEIRLRDFPIGPGNELGRAPSMEQVDANYSSDEQKNLFLEGHTHIRQYLEGVKSPQAIDIWNRMGLGDQGPSKGTSSDDLQDYGPILDRGSASGQKGAAPSMVITPLGVTIYGTGANHMTPAYQPSPNNTYITYKTLK